MILQVYCLADTGFCVHHAKYYFTIIILQMNEKITEQ